MSPEPSIKVGSLKLICLCILGVFLAVGAIFIHAPLSNIRTAYHALFGERDSWYPMLTAADWLEAHPGEDIYQQIFFVSHIKFQYPLTALLFLHNMEMPTVEQSLRLLNLGNLVFAALCAIGMALLTVTLADQLGVRGADRRLRWHLVAVSVVATACFLPLLRGLALGQVQVVIDALFVLACCAHARGFSGAAGALIGLCVLIKPQMGFFVAWAVLHRVWPFLLGWMAVVATGLLASVIRFGPSWPIDFIKVLTYIDVHGEAFAPNQSVNGMVNRLLGNGDAAHWNEHGFAPFDLLVYASTQIATVVFIWVGLAFGLRTAHVRGSLCAMIVAGICFTAASPVVWDHHWGVLLPAFAFCFIALLSRNAKAGWAGPWALLAVAYFLTANDLPPLDQLAGTWLSPLSSYILVGGLGVTILTGWLGLRVTVLAASARQADRAELVT